MPTVTLKAHFDGQTIQLDESVNEGDVVLTSLPQADGKVKNRR